MPTATTTAAAVLRLLLLSFTLRPLSSTTTTLHNHHHRRRILHQPFLPQDSPPTPSPPSPPEYPFTSSAPDNTNNNNPFFPNYPSPPPPPPSPASFASFPANISSLTVPSPSSKPTSTSTKLIVAAAAAVLAAVAVVSLAVFLHLRKRTTTHGSPSSSSSFNKSKTQRSDNSSTISFNQIITPNTSSHHHIPKLQRPSQTSSEFLYLGTLVNSHVTAFTATSTSTTTNYTNALYSQKLDSPELRPLPPLNTPHTFPSKDDESEEFYSPKGSVNGRDSSIGTRSDSTRAFAAIQMENFNASTSNSSSTCSCCSDPQSGPGSPARSLSPSPINSIPNSPDLIEIQTTAPPPLPSRFHESPSPSPPSSSSTEKRFSRSEESSPRISNTSDRNFESPVRISSSVAHNSTVIPTPPDTQGLVFPEYASPLPHSSSSPRSSNASDHNVGSPVSIGSTDQHNTVVTDRQIQVPVFQESASPPLSPPRNSSVSDQNLESPVSISSPAHHHSPTISPTLPEVQGLICLEFTSPLPSNSRSEESSPRVSNISDQNVDYLMRNSSPVEHTLSPERYSKSEECSPRTSNVESPIRISSPVHHNTTVVPPPVSVPPPPPPPPPTPPLSQWESPNAPTSAAKNPVEPIPLEIPMSVSPIELTSNDSQTLTNDGNKESPNKEKEYSSETADRNEESTPKPKLKPLHWDKVRASSDREMVWDQLKCSSFKLNEEMIETLFIVNTPKSNPKEATRWQVLPPPGQDNGDRVLDPKKAQNIAILLKALHVTVDEVCEGLLEGNADLLGTELLESLLKMAPTKEEERKLKEYKEDSPIKLGAAERFLKGVVDIPYAFKRVEVMLYISNFESEVEYLKKSFATLESACEELRTSRMFLKLLEAVLKTGNRMNVGTNRGDAHAFKLDTLLKLVDIKGADGKTTLLHFVVQEITRSEGILVISALTSELSNVKKAAVMDAEVIANDVSKLSKGIENVTEIVAALNESDSCQFSDTVNGFVGRAEEEIFRVRAQESVALTLVKEITEYFHGNTTKEEAHPFRIFMVVRDFLTILDRVCKEVGLVNERTMVSSAHRFPVPVNPMLQQVPGVFHNRGNTCDDDDDTFPLNV
ncbi:hypothetical protein ABFX02_14G062000 [Erythranthe guttata]